MLPEGTVGTIWARGQINCWVHVKVLICLVLEKKLSAIIRISRNRLGDRLRFSNEVFEITYSSGNAGNIKLKSYARV